MAEQQIEPTETMLTQDNVQHLQQTEEKQAVMEVARMVTETEILDHGSANECPSADMDSNNDGLETTTEGLESTGTTGEDLTRSGSDLAINIMSHMEISRLIANVVKRMQEDGSQAGVTTHNLYHMENLLKQIVTNQNTITINQNSLLRNQQAIIQKVDILNSILAGALGDETRLAEKGLKNQMATSTPRSPGRAGTKRNYSMDGTAALVQAAEQVGMINGSPQVGTVAMTITQNLNGVTTTALLPQDGDQRPSTDDEQSFSSPQQTTDLSTISPSALYLTTSTPEQMQSQGRTGVLNEVQLIRLKARSQSVGNFAVHLVREMFKPLELLSKNVSGTRNKEKLDPDRVARIRKYVFEMFPTSELEEDKVWGDCRKAIDEFLRRPNKRKNQDRLSHEGMDSFSLKKDKLSDSSVITTE